MDAKAIEKIEKHFTWIAANPSVATMTPELMKLINRGVFYLGGRDKFYRPSIFMNGAEIARIDKETPGGLSAELFSDLWYFFY